MSKVVVVGAGVTGLTTAYFLSEKGYDVTIVFKKAFFDGYDDACYASNFAGANWHSFASHDEIELQEYDKPAYRKFLHLAKTDPKAGIILKKNVSYIEKETFAKKYNNDPSKVSHPWFKDFVEDYKIIPQHELPSNIGFGTSYLGVVITTPIYLNYLLAKCVENGATYKRATLEHIRDAEKYHHSGIKPDVIVNCTGLLAAKLGGVEDKEVYPIRGQIIVVENDCKDVMSVKFEDPQNPDDLLYIMPRKEGGAIIGGCFLADIWNNTPDYEMANRTLQRAKKYCPEFVDPCSGNPSEFKVVRYQVGFRPGRKGGPKVEIEGNIVHNYGAGGTGYQSSYGTCSKAVSLVEAFLSKPKL
ncbi:hypothetical protein PACTADRAFT_74321 [Pachysolen tannophilus NRRL Y-2460]|uniref:FAD dependent oxidoreductase domain-containing protein n=1 Tax=Pachysolen tannophilus NRRL Y-2460 TaxID=669874 RepID=A0A1E4TYF9_PACTA|nr:hypothetical protein PACTADRAFT_74321 [Pachysolen tannophilus NRRL Y-2460]